jgi:hypothetical protein
MALNTSPIYSGVGDIQWPTTPISASNASYDATAVGGVSIITTASPSGSFIQRIRFKASGTTVATVARVFINNGGTVTVAGNNVLFDEITLPLTTATATAATAVYELPMNIALPPNYKILATVGTAQTPAGGWYVSAVGGSYVTT